MAFSATTEWDVRTSGSNSNGGGFDTASSGTDRSQQDATFQAYTDLVIDGAVNTKMTSAAFPFGATDVGNVVNITSGTGFTVQRVQIVSVAAAVATCDKSLGTLGSTGGVGNLGGGLLTISTPPYVAGNKIHIKAGTYTLTSAIALTVTGTIQAPVRWIGYNSSHNDGGTKPLITTATNSTALVTINNASYFEWRNLKFTNTAGTKAPAIQGVTASAAAGFWMITDCNLDTFTIGMDTSSRGPVDLWVVRSLIQNCTSHAMSDGNGVNVYLVDSVFYNNTGDGYNSNAHNFSIWVTDCIFAKNANGIYDTGTTRTDRISVTSSTFVDGTAAGIRCDETTTAAVTALRNNIFYGNGTYGVNFAFTSSGTDNSVVDNDYNAYGSNTSGPRTGLTAGAHDVTLSADPFTDKANKDWTLNSTAGGGASCRSAAFPGALQLGGTGYEDIGALRHQDPAGGGGNTILAGMGIGLVVAG